MLILAGVGAGPSGDFQSIATVTVGSGGQSTITFSSIPNTYKHLQLRLFGRATGSSDYATQYTVFNSDTGSNYAYHQLFGEGASPTVAAQVNMSFVAVQLFAGGLSSANIFGGIIVDILDYADTNKFKTVKQLGGVERNGSGYIILNSGLWRSTSAISSISMTTDGNFAQYTHAALYGIKG